MGGFYGQCEETDIEITECELYKYKTDVLFNQINVIIDIYVKFILLGVWIKYCGKFFLLIILKLNLLKNEKLMRCVC